MAVTRHPKFTLGAAFLVLCTFLFLARHQSEDDIHSDTTFTQSHGDIPSLRSRLTDAEAAYQDVLKQRKGLIQKFGPTTDKIEMFPPTVPPYPPYTMWDFFPASFNCPHEVLRLGALGDGGKWVCGISRLATKPDCVVYSVGINHESSFEAEILSRTSGCQIWGYDFSVNSFGPEIPSTQSYRSHFFPYGLSGTDAHGPNDKDKMYTLQSLMDINGHKWIDILKVDIESWEFDTLTTLLNSYREKGQALPFGQLQLEIHAWNKKFPDYLAFWENLESMGLRPFWTEPNLVYANYNRGGTPDLAEYSFINIKGNHELITDRTPSRTGNEHPHQPPKRD